MAFAGDMGPAAAMIPDEIFFPNVDDTADYDANDRIIWYNSFGTEVDGGQRLIQSMCVQTTSQGSPSNPVLAAFIDATITGASADTGVLVTAAPGANQHGIPANFGPGRGNWVTQDRARMSAILTKHRFNALAATCNFLIPIVFSVAAGDLTVAWKNTSGSPLSELIFILKYDHTLVF